MRWGIDMELGQIFRGIMTKFGFGGRGLEFVAEYLPQDKALADRIAEASKSLTDHGARVDMLGALDKKAAEMQKEAPKEQEPPKARAGHVKRGVGAPTV